VKPILDEAELDMISIATWLSFGGYDNHLVECLIAKLEQRQVTKEHD
jgi:hypothetical protein